MDNSWIALLFPICLFIICACFYTIAKRHLEDEGVAEYTEMMTDEDDPALKFESECRTAILNSILACISTAWNIHLDEKHISHDTTGYNVDLVTIAKLNYIFRVYCNWSRNIIRVELLAIDDEDPQFKPMRRHVVLRIKHGFVSFSKFYTILLKWYGQYYATFISALQNNQGYQMVLAERELDRKVTIDAAGVALLKLMAFARKTNSPNYDASLAVLLAYIGQNKPELYNKLVDTIFPEDEEEDPKSSDEIEKSTGEPQQDNL